MHPDEQARRAVEYNVHDCAGPVSVRVYAAYADELAAQPKQRFEDTFSAETVVLNHYFPQNDNVPVAEQPARPRPGNFLQTYSGRRFYPMDPRADEVHIEDIAHSLAMQCRYAGHCQSFYSVAEHSVLMSRAFYSRTEALWALLHDAAEAYLVDIPRPVKMALPGYKEAEERVLAAVCDRFGLPHEMPWSVKQADNLILADEIAQNMAPMEWHSDYPETLGVDLEFWPPEEAEDEFLTRFAELMKTERRAA